jgi:hypothetical protein
MHGAGAAVQGAAGAQAAGAQAAGAQAEEAGAGVGRFVVLENTADR